MTVSPSSLLVPILAALLPVSAQEGRALPTSPEQRGAVVAALEKQDLMVKIDPLAHAVGHCYRCHTVVEPNLSKQWFVKTQPLAEKAIAADRPNIIVIMADDMGYADAGFTGATDIKTPHLDRLAAGGIRFTQAYAGNTVCSPSRVSLFTGRDGRLMENNSNTVQLREIDVTIAHVLKHAGYDKIILRGKAPELAAKVDVLLGNLEDGIPADAYRAARVSGASAWTTARTIASPSPLPAALVVKNGSNSRSIWSDAIPSP